MIEYLTIAALIGAGLNAGVFSSFSTFTMNGLKRLEPAMGAARSRPAIRSRVA